MNKTKRIPVERRYWRAEIPEVPPAANDFMRTHFRARKEKKSVWYALIYGAFFHEGITKAKGKRSVTITLRSKNQRDHANQYLAADKLILDNLKALGWIVDDSPKWIDLSIQGEVGSPRTVIEVSE